jgi:hypothetical protein
MDSVGPISKNSFLINLCTLYVNALGRECRVIFGIQGHFVLCSSLLKLFKKMRVDISFSEVKIASLI